MIHALRAKNCRIIWPIIKRDRSGALFSQRVLQADPARIPIVISRVVEGFWCSSPLDVALFRFIFAIIIVIDNCE